MVFGQSKCKIAVILPSPQYSNGADEGVYCPQRIRTLATLIPSLQRVLTRDNQRYQENDDEHYQRRQCKFRDQVFDGNMKIFASYHQTGMDW